MPYKANEARRHKIPRAPCKVINWPEHDKALHQRESLTVWVTAEAFTAWQPPRTGYRGRQRAHSDVAIATGHLLRLAFGRPWRQTEGLLRSITVLLGIDVGVPDRTTFSRRSPGLALATSLAQVQASGPVHVVIDATGLKVYDAGEWPVEKHRERGKRTWRKHDGDPVYRAVSERQPNPPVPVIIPPRFTAVPSPAPLPPHVHNLIFAPKPRAAAKPVWSAMRPLFTSRNSAMTSAPTDRACNTTAARCACGQHPLKGPSTVIVTECESGLEARRYPVEEGTKLQGDWLARRIDDGDR